MLSTAGESKSLVVPAVADVGQLGFLKCSGIVAWQKNPRDSDKNHRFTSWDCSGLKWGWIVSRFWYRFPPELRANKLSQSITNWIWVYESVTVALMEDPQSLALVKCSWFLTYQRSDQHYEYIIGQISAICCQLPHASILTLHCFKIRLRPHMYHQFVGGGWLDYRFRWVAVAASCDRSMTITNHHPTNQNRSDFQQTEHLQIVIPCGLARVGSDQFVLQAPVAKHTWAAFASRLGGHHTEQFVSVNGSEI